MGTRPRCVAKTGGSVAKAPQEPKCQSSLVCLYEGDPATPPIFCIHGIWSHTGRFAALGSALRGPSIYAIVIDNDTRASVSAMAIICMQNMRAIQPAGPYHIAGHASGGLLAYEIASQLEDAGEVAACVFLFDALAQLEVQRETMELSKACDDVLSLIASVTSSLLEAPASLAHPPCGDAERLVVMSLILGQHVSSSLSMPSSACAGRTTLTLADALQVSHERRRLLTKHVPRRNGARVVLFVTEDLEERAPDLGWQRFVGERLDVHVVDGDAFEGSNAARLANIISRELRPRRRAATAPSHSFSGDHRPRCRAAWPLAAKSPHSVVTPEHVSARSQAA